MTDDLDDVQEDSVPEHGNSPLIHYQRADLDASLHLGFQTAQAGGHGFLYALVFPKANYMQVGIGVSSRYDLNRKHQPLENLHYHEVIRAAHEIATGAFRLADGPLTQRFFETAPVESIRHRTFTKTDRLLCSGALAYVMQKMHREVWGDPVATGTVIVTDPEDFREDLLVRYDPFLDRVVIGLTPKKSLWTRMTTGRLIPNNDAASDPAADAGEFVELLRYNRRTLPFALSAWADQGAVALPAALSVAPWRRQVTGAVLDQVIEAATRAAEQAGWA